MSKSLSSLVGQYTSDSENEESEQQTVPTTSWTQCVDPATELPYYWNIETKEVTWEKPDEYQIYLNYILEKSPNIPDNCWIVGYSDNKIPYYVNEYTRVVSWKKPLNFIENQYSNIEPCNSSNSNNNISSKSSTITIANSNSNSNNNDNNMKLLSQELKLTSHKNKLKKHSNLETRKSNFKKKIPKELDSASDDEKIELISSYKASSDTSSDEELDKSKKDQKIESKKKFALVAAYETDESDSDEDKLNNTMKSQNLTLPTAKAQIENFSITANSSNCSKLKETSTVIIEKNSNSSSSSSSSTNLTHNNQTVDTFASIITGGKVVDVEMDEEINRLKMELEKELPGFIEQKCTETKPIVENNFDEKQFKRKRRIQFNSNASTTTTATTTPITKPVENDSCENSQTENAIEQNKEKPKKNSYSNFTRSHVEFTNNNDTVKETTELSTITSEDNQDDDGSNQNSDHKEMQTKKENIDSKSDGDGDNDESNLNDNLKLQIDNLSELIIGKVKFLSVGRPEVSAVQIMNIQLETLLAAYRSSSLSYEYFFKWLKAISDDLLNLEKNAAPDGWECNWDRQNSQYIYKNLETNEIRWEFPVTTEIENQTAKDAVADVNVKQNDIINNGGVIDPNTSSVVDDHDSKVEIKPENISRGEDEMDISTTPPPNEHEQIKYLGTYPMSETWDADNAPPPPVISKKAVITKPPTMIQSLPVDINCELASFYSEVASLETPPTSTATATETIETTTPPPPIISSSSIANVNINLVPTNSDDSRNSPPLPPPPPTITTVVTSVTATTSTTVAPVASTAKTISNDIKTNSKKKSDDNSISGIPPKKKKKLKIHGMEKMQEISSLVAKWNKVKKELGSNN